MTTQNENVFNKKFHDFNIEFDFNKHDASVKNNCFYLFLKKQITQEHNHGLFGRGKTLKRKHNFMCNF